MHELLKMYILEVLEEMQNANVPDELRSPKNKKNKKQIDDEDENEIDEMNVVANIAGYTAPLGASSADVGKKPTKPGQRLKKRKKDFVRWK